MNTPPPTPSARIAHPRRWLAFGVLLVALTWGAVALPTEVKPFIFYALVIGFTGMVMRRWSLMHLTFISELTALQATPLAGIWQRGGAVIGICLMLAAALALQPHPNSSPELGFSLFLVGVLAIGLSLLIGTPPPTIAPHETLYQRVLRWQRALQSGRKWWQHENYTLRWGSLWAGILCLAIVQQVNTIPADSKLPIEQFILQTSAHLQMLLLVGGSLLVVRGLIGQAEAAPKADLAVEPLRQRVWTWLQNHRLLVAILLVATVARLWHLEDWVRRFLDELHYMEAAARLRDHSNQQIIAPFSTVTAFSWVYPYLQYWTTLLFTPSFTAVRIVSAVFGTAQVGAVYFLGRQLFDRRTALLAAALLATFPVHLHFSRIGINNIADPLFGIMAFGFLARGLQTQHPRDFAWAGFCLGWTQYFYEGGRLFYPLFMVCWLIWLGLFIRRRQGFYFPSLRNLAILGIAAGVLLLPVYYTRLTLQLGFAPRFTEMRDARQDGAFDVTETISLQERLQPILEKLPLPLRALIELPEDGWFYGGDTGLVLVYLAPLLLLGVAQAFWRWRSPSGSLVFWWILAAAVGIALIRDSLSTPRYLVLLPAIVLAMGFGFSATVALLTKRETRRLTLAMILLVTGIQAGYYFGVHLPNYYTDLVYAIKDDKGRHLVDTDDALLRAMDLPPNTEVYIFSRVIIWQFNTYAAPLYWGRADLPMQHVFPSYLLRIPLHKLPRDRNYAFFLQQDDPQTRYALERFFTFGADPTGNDGFSPYPIPRDVQLRLYFAPATEPHKDE